MNKNMQLKWNEINWKDCENKLFILQDSLVKAVEKNEIEKIKTYQSQIMRSFAARALAVKLVISNKGKNTPGVDKKTFRTDGQKMLAVSKLKTFMKDYRPDPVLRVYIPKPFSNEKRPLGIPTMYDRCVQALVLSAYEPIVETKADRLSFGFRKGRSIQDVATYIKLVCGSINGKRHILEVDIRKFFDSIDKQWMLNNLSVPSKYLKKLLDSGIMDNNTFLESESGVPQGGIISPTMANETLDGLEKSIKSLPNTLLIRYADDFIVAAKDKETLEKAKIYIKSFLYERKLEINETKTWTTTIEKGFDFVGFHFKEYFDKKYAKGTKKGIFLVQPSTKSISNVKGKIKAAIQKYPNAKPRTLIMTLNSILRGWANNYRGCSTRKAFREISNYTFQLLKKWVYKKHGPLLLSLGAIRFLDQKQRQKSAKRRKYMQKYFQKDYTKATGNKWVFIGHNEKKEVIQLFQIGYVNKRRHNLIRLNPPINPFLLSDKDHFLKKTKTELRNSTLRTKRVIQLYTRQNGICPHCDKIMAEKDDIQIHHHIPVKDGGSNLHKNLKLMHTQCHRQIHAQKRT